MEKFRIAYKITARHEGGYSFDPDDMGGETYKGISRRHWPKWEGWKFVDLVKKNYPLDELAERLNSNEGVQMLVEQFYYEAFWLPLNAHYFDQPIANELFDTAVNMGRIMAGTYFQQSLNKLNRNEKDYPDLITDGQIGMKTLEAYGAYMATHRFTSRNREQLIKWLLKWMNYFQLRKYDLITDKNPKQEKFIPGWTERG